MIKEHGEIKKSIIIITIMGVLNHKCDSHRNWNKKDVQMVPNNDARTCTPLIFYYQCERELKPTTTRK